MFDEPSEEPTEKASGAAERAKEKSDEFRMHSELAAVFEAVRKFDAELRTRLDSDLARDVQRSILKLERSRSPESPILPPESLPEAKRLLTLPETADLPTNDYHIHRRPGEVMVIRWLAGDEVQNFYERLQAHFDAALEGLKEDEHQAHDWKKSPEIKAYLAEVDKIEVKMADRYLRDPIREHALFVLSTQTADEINIQYLCETVMGIPPADLVGGASAPPEDPSQHDLAWFFKLFSLRGSIDGTERMCFFAFLQKTEDTFDLE